MMKVARQPKWVEDQIMMSEYVGKRKHSSQFTQKEISSIMGKLKSVDSWGISYHAFDRLKEKGIDATYDDIVSTIYNCEIVEYKIDYNERINRCEERVVIRGLALTNTSYNLCVVYSLTNKRVVTVWLNRISDKHSTLDWSLYDEHMKVFSA